LGKCLNKCEKNWKRWELYIEEPFNPERNLGNRVNNYKFKKIIKEFRRAVKYLYNANLELCCQMQIYDELEYEYCDDGTPIITLKALYKAKINISDKKLIKSKELIKRYEKGLNDIKNQIRLINLKWD
ncbi:12286_t:CDS:2, partial [Gigaspora margarita]